MSALYLLASTFGLVFFLGLQSQLVNNGHFAAAFCNSLAIGACNLVLFKLAPDATGLEIVAYLAGPFGIVASMLAYRRIRHAAPTTTAPRPRPRAAPSGPECPGCARRDRAHLPDCYYQPDPEARVWWTATQP